MHSTHRFMYHFFQLSVECVYHFRAEFTKYIVEPALGISGVGGAMAAYGVFDAIVSMAILK